MTGWGRDPGEGAPSLEPEFAHSVWFAQSGTTLPRAPKGWGHTLCLRGPWKAHLAARGPGGGVPHSSLHPESAAS